MAMDMVAVRIVLSDGRVMNLRFRLSVFQRLAAEARRSACTLQAYLTRRVLASGLGEEVTGGQELERPCVLVLDR
jgi:hypothetical protein